VIIGVRLSGSEPTIIRRSALVQQLSVRKDPRPYVVVVEGQGGFCPRRKLHSGPIEL